MHQDVIDLRSFYATALGAAVRGHLAGRIGRIWPDLGGLRVMGFGYATPYLSPEGLYHHDDDATDGKASTTGYSVAGRVTAERVIALMPEGQGIHHWPDNRAGLVALSEESDLPLPDASIDRVLLVHAIESSEELRAMLREIWRVLAPGGRILAVVPNRRGLWARFEATPFGHGRPFSLRQLTLLLRDGMFSPVKWDSSLLFPPSQMRSLLRFSGGIERIAARFGRNFAGVHLVEATKQIYAAPTIPARAQRIAARARGIAATPRAAPTGSTQACEAEK